jgi:hypothetical protein
MILVRFLNLKFQRGLGEMIGISNSSHESLRETNAIDGAWRHRLTEFSPRWFDCPSPPSRRQKPSTFRKNGQS